MKLPHIITIKGNENLGLELETRKITLDDIFDLVHLIYTQHLLKPLKLIFQIFCYLLYTYLYVIYTVVNYKVVAAIKAIRMINLMEKSNVENRSSSAARFMQSINRPERLGKTVMFSRCCNREGKNPLITI